MLRGGFLRALLVLLFAAASLTCGESAGPNPDVKITRVVVTPALDTLRSLAEQQILTVTGYIGTQAYDGGVYTWDRSDTAFLSLAVAQSPSKTAQVAARKNGTSFVRVREAGGAVDSARIVVNQRVALILAPQLSRAFRGCPVSLHAFAFDALNNAVPGAALAYASTDTTLARVDSSGLVTPRVAGVDTIVISSQGVTRRVALIIAAAATPTIQTSGAFGRVTTVGVGQYALAFGDLDPSFPYYLAPARFRVASSDTTLLKSFPADTEGYLVSTTLLAGPVRLVGRAVGSVTLTPYLCDAAGPSVPFHVTRARLKLFSVLDSTARTDDPPVNVNIRNQDTTGALQFAAVPLTVRTTTTDTNVIRPDSAYRHVPVGTDQWHASFAFIDSGTARIVLLDSSGSVLPDTSSAVHIRYPPLYIFSDGGGRADTVHIGMRQKPYFDVYRARVGLDRFVSGQPLVVHVSSTDSTIVRAGTDSSEIPVGQSATTGRFDIAARDTRGVAIFTARAYRHTDAQSVIFVGRPAVQVRGPSPDAAIYAGDPGGGGVQVFAIDSATGSVGFPTENVTFALTVSDTSVISLDSTTVTVPAGDYASTFSDITFKKPGTVTITATDPRVAPYAYAPGTSTPFTVLAPYLAADSAVSLGVRQYWSFTVLINGTMPPGEVVHLAHKNPTVASLSDTIGHVIVPGYVGVQATGLSVGVDTVIATASGFRPDTGVIVVAAGTISVPYWPSTLAVGDSWPLAINILAPNGEGRITADTVLFTLNPNAIIEFHQDGAVISSVTMPAGQQVSSPNFYVKAKAAGTGSVMISAPNYTPLTQSVSISP